MNKIILISHRGNINGKLESWENEPTYIDLAIKKGYDVEIDIWFINNILYLGHDKPLYGINNKFLLDRYDKLWIHCKNIEAIDYVKNIVGELNYFFHNTDDATLTSKGYIWTYPGKALTKNSIAVLPELNNVKIPDKISGICSDYIELYK